MKWILVWWVIHPGHSQVMHIEKGFDSESACVARLVESVPRDKPIHWHCSKE